MGEITNKLDMSDIRKLSPKEFVLQIKQLRDDIAKIRQQRIQAIDRLKQQHEEICHKLQNEKSLLQNKYLLDNPIGIMVYVDHVQANNQSLGYGDNLQVKYEPRKEQVVRYLKNGQRRYSTKTVKHLIFTTNSETCDVTTTAKVAEIRQTINYIDKAIEQYPESKNILDKQMMLIDDKLFTVNSKLDQLIGDVDNKATEIENKYQSEIDAMVALGNKKQLRELHKGWWIAGRVALAIVVIIVINVIAATIRTSIERGRDYYISVKDSYTFDCDLQYDSNTGQFVCRGGNIEGTFSKYDTVEIRADWSAVSTNNNSFSYSVRSDYVYPSDYQVSNFSIDNLIKKLSTATVKLEIYNKYLNSTVSNKDVTIHWNISNDERAMISNKNQEWRDEQARKEAERQAEEAARKAEEQRKANEEAARKTAEEAAAQAKAREEARQKTAAEAARQQQSQPRQSQSAVPRNNSNSYTPPAPQSNGTSYRSCAEVRAAGKAPLYAGQPGYSAKLDRDKDGVACE